MTVFWIPYISHRVVIIITFRQKAFSEQMQPPVRSPGVSPPGGEYSQLLTQANGDPPLDVSEGKPEGNQDAFGFRLFV